MPAWFKSWSTNYDVNGQWKHDGLKSLARLKLQNARRELGLVEDLNKVLVKILQSYCSKLSLKSDGPKIGLVARLLPHWIALRQAQPNNGAPVIPPATTPGRGRGGPGLFNRRNRRGGGASGSHNGRGGGWDLIGTGFGFLSMRVSF